VARRRDDRRRRVGVPDPWNWYSNDDAIHYTLGLLGALIGPLFGILIAGYYVAGRQRIKTDAMFTMDPTGPTGTAAASTRTR
jgi:cytosine/uracil/thiamine/allantoin permease